MTQSNNSHIEYSFSKESAFSGSDVRAFIMPTFTNHNRQGRPIFNTPDNKSLSEAIEKNQNLDVFLNQSYITNLSGVSLSTHRDKTPITSLGRIDPLGFVASRRTVAGSMVFWMSDASPLSQLLSAEYRSELLHADELPPFDLYLTFLTENDMWSSTIIYGITILDEGMVIENANGEPIAVTYSYMAMDSTPVVPGFFGSVYERLYKKDKRIINWKEVGKVTRDASNNLVTTAKNFFSRLPDSQTQISSTPEKNYGLIGRGNSTWDPADQMDPYTGETISPGDPRYDASI